MSVFPARKSVHGAVVIVYCVLVPFASICSGKGSYTFHAFTNTVLGLFLFSAPNDFNVHLMA